jgi:pimeloyl-ACP methyl ester carboxylesterase
MHAHAGREREVAIGDGVGGTLAMPDAAGAVPCVVMLHGFGGHREESGGLFALLAQRLVERNIASLRIDYPGDRDNPRRFTGTTFAACRDACLVALRVASELDSVDRTRLGLLGFSFGAAVAIACLSGPVPVRTLALWGAIMRPRDDLADSFGREAVARAESEGAFALDWGKTRIVVERAFLEALARLDPFEDLGRYRGSVLALAGSRDRHARYIERIAEASAEARLAVPGVIEDADHFFNATSGENVITNAALTITADVLGKTLAAD